jgi:hypothetical protein
MKGQLPWSVERLRGQGVEQFGRSEALVSSLHDHLSFFDHVHEFGPDQGALSCIKRFEPQHRVVYPELADNSNGSLSSRLRDAISRSSSLETCFQLVHASLPASRHAHPGSCARSSF